MTTTVLTLIVAVLTASLILLIATAARRRWSTSREPDPNELVWFTGHAVVKRQLLSRPRWFWRRRR